MASGAGTQDSNLLISQLIDKGQVSFQQLLVVFLCLTFNMLDGFDITAMAVTANAIGQDMQLAEDKLGLVFSFSLAGMMLGAMFLGSVSDVFGRRTMVIATLLIIGGSVLLTAYVANLWQLIGLRFISGLGAGAMLASQATLASEYSPEKYRALAVTVVTSGYPLGAMMTGLVAGFIVPDYGWQGMFILGGVVTLAMCVIAFLFLPESLQFLCEKRPAGALQRFNKILKKFDVAAVDALPAKKAAASVVEDSESVLAKMLKLVTPEHRASTLLLWSAFFMCFLTLYFLMSWTPKLMVNAGFSEQTGHYAFSLLNFGGVLGIFMLGLLTTRWMLSSLIAVFLVGTALCMWAFAALPVNETLILLLIFVIGLLMNGGFCGLYAAAAKLYPTEIRSTGVGWGIGIGRFGAVVAPVVAGFMIAAGMSMSVNFIIFAVPVLLGGLLAYRLRLS